MIVSGKKGEEECGQREGGCGQKPTDTAGAGVLLAVAGGIVAGGCEVLIHGCGVHGVDRLVGEMLDHVAASLRLRFPGIHAGGVAVDHDAPGASAARCKVREDEAARVNFVSGADV